ncbi:hypothetical protein D3C76_798850 [compost metagenome]
MSAAKQRLLIGLAGGTHESRRAIAGYLMRPAFGLVELLPLGAYDCSSASEFVRGRALEAALGQRPRRRDPGLVHAHVLSEVESQALREAGGFVWHLVRPFSRSVRIRHGDLMVTDRFGEVGEQLDPEEALCEVLLKLRAH